MANPAGRRMMAEIDGDFVVFLIGARFNSFHLLKTVLDLGGRRGMKHMLDYLVAHPEKGLLGYQMGLPAIVQYWRSFDHLEVIYGNMPPFGLGKAARLVSLAEGKTARQRFRAAASGTS